MPTKINSPKLASDILESQFGPVAVRLLAQTDATRIVAVYVVATNQVVQYAEVTYDASGAALYPAVHQQIREGAMMGKSFKEAGIPFRRRTLKQSPHRLPRRLMTLFGTDQPIGTRVEVVFEIGPDNLPYARNTEIYSPSVQWPDSQSAPTHKLD